MAEIKNDYAGQDYVYLTIALDGTAKWDVIVQMLTDNPSWFPCDAWLHDPSIGSFNALRSIVGFSGGVPQHYIVDRDGNLRFALQSGIYNKSQLTNVVDELL